MPLEPHIHVAEHIYTDRGAYHFQLETNYITVSSCTDFNCRRANPSKGRHFTDTLSAIPMMTSSNGNIFSVTGPLCGEFTGQLWISLQRQVTRSFDVFFDLRLNKQLSKQSQMWWFDTSSRQFYDVTVMPTSCEGNHWSSVDCQYKSPVMTQHQMCHVKRAKGKRDQTTFKGNRRDYFRPYLLPLPFCVSPHVLDIGVERYSGENVIRNKEDEQHTSKDNPTSQWHIDTDLVSCWLYAF